jgi:hypothetical protein
MSYMSCAHTHLSADDRDPGHIACSLPKCKGLRWWWQCKTEPHFLFDGMKLTVILAKRVLRIPKAFKAYLLSSGSEATTQHLSEQSVLATAAGIIVKACRCVFCRETHRERERERERLMCTHIHTRRHMPAHHVHSRDKRAADTALEICNMQLLFPAATHTH